MIRGRGASDSLERVLWWRRVGILLLTAIVVTTALQLATRSLSLALVTFALSFPFAYVAVDKMRLRAKLVHEGDVAGARAIVENAVRTAVPSPYAPTGWKKGKLIVRPTELYRIRISFQAEGGRAVVALEAESPARAFLDRRTILDRSSTWEKLMAALGDAGFRLAS